MKRSNNYADDDDDFENGVLKDGRTFRVPMFLRDGRPNPDMTDLQRSIATSRVTAADGAPAGHRPGFIVDTNDAARRLRDEAYDAYDRQQAEAWRDAAGEGSEAGNACTVRNAEFPDDQGAPGHLKMRGGKLVCVPRARADASTMDAQAAYRAYDAEIADAWRHAR